MKAKVIRKIVNNDYLFSIISKITGLFISIVVSSMTARFFGAELKGVSSVVENHVSLYSMFLGLGVYQAYPFFRKKEEGIYNTYIYNISSMFIIYVGLAVAVFFIILRCNLDIYFGIAVLIMPITVYIKQLNYVVLMENPKRRNISSLIISSSEVIIMAVMFIFFKPSIVTVIGYYIFTVLINLVLSFINLRFNPFKIKFKLNRIWGFIKFGFIPMLTYVCMTINYRIDVQMLSRFDCVSYADIGVYGVGVALASKIWLIPDAIKDILLSKLVKGKNEDEVAKVIRISLFICIVSVAFLIILGKPIVRLLYGEEFINAYYIMLLMLVGVIGMIFYKMVYSYNIAQGKRFINLLFLLIAAIINIVGNLITIPIWGIYGAAIVSVVSYLTCGICFLCYYKFSSKISFCKIILLQKEDIAIFRKFFNKKRRTQLNEGDKLKEKNDNQIEEKK